MGNAPCRGAMAGVTAIAAALLVGTETAHAVTAPSPEPDVRAVVTSVSVTTQVRIASRVPEMPRTFRLKLHEEYQSTNYFCVPAATAMSLWTFGVKVSQALLAQRMKTTTRGTGGDSAASVMDSYIHPRRFDDRIVADVVGHPEILMQRVSYDVGSLHRAPVIQVWMERLPWNQATLRGRWIGHAIVAYGYDQRAGTITVFDPWRPSGGTHTLSARSLAMTLQSGAGMHYIARV